MLGNGHFMNTTPQSTVDVLTVTLNPAIDQTVTIPNFAAGKVNRVEQSRSDPGGKGVNVASFLTDAGHRVAVTGFLGQDNAALFDALFAEKGIADHFVRIAGQTRVGIKIADPVLNDTTDINFAGQAPTRADVAALFDLTPTLPGEWVVLAGSIPPGVEPAIYRDLAQAFRQHGKRVVLDTSGEPLQHALDAIPSIVKPNIHELETLVGRALPTRDAVIAAARDLLARGLDLVAVSMGADGALFVDNETVVRARPPRVRVESTVGAGDAMVAGTVAAQLRGLVLADTARLATAFSVDAVTHVGSGLSAWEAVEAGMEQVTAETLP